MKTRPILLASFLASSLVAGPGLAASAPASAAGIGADSSKLFNWSVGSAPAAPVPAEAPTLRPVDDDSKPAADEIRVHAWEANDGESRPYNLKKGTTAIEALTKMGWSSMLTGDAIIVIQTGVEVEAESSKKEEPVNTESGRDSSPASPSDENKLKWTYEMTTVDVGMVRAGKAKDVVFRDISPSVYDISLEVHYSGFYFPGGTPGEFVAALERHFGVDWSVVQIPPEMRNVRIPEFRLERKEWFRDPRQTLTTSSAIGVVELYNEIATKYPAIGTWSFAGDRDENYYHPAIVMLSPPPPDKAAAGGPGLMVKAMPLNGISDKKWQALEADIANAKDQADDHQRRLNSAGPGLDGTVSIQRDSKILVIVGNEAYIDMAESVVEAYVKNENADRTFPEINTSAAKP